ncbi:MAG: glycosyltransferase family 2 protein [Candidatus Wenzhouxiangella sp. M2_3B_020]
MIVMTLLVHNEADIVRENVAYHHAVGVDHFVATDNASTDGTREILEEFQRSGILTLLDEPSSAYLQDVWATNMAMIARDRFGADWVISNDADEFWRPRAENLKKLLADTRQDSVRCARTNMFTSLDHLATGHWTETLLYRSSKRIPIDTPADIYNGDLAYPFFYYDLPPKVIASTHGLRRLARGAHRAFFDHDARSGPGAIDIFHFPVRSASTFVRKIRRIGHAVRNTRGLGERISWKYRRWLRFLELDENEDRALADALPDSDRLIDDLRTGVVVEDTTMLDELGVLGIAPRRRSLA